MTTQARIPRGIPGGGQFSYSIAGESTVGLAGPGIATAPDLIDLTPETVQVLEACQRAGGRPLIVGGSVRDALFSRRSGQSVVSKDIDIEVHELSHQEQLIDELKTAGPVNEQGVSFGVLSVKVNGQDFDISLPRRDSKQGEGHRGFEVEVDANLTMEEAFARRDFTINAIGWDPATGELIDPYGGTDDIENKVLRHTSEAFREDPLRVLRAVQLAGRLDLDMAEETAQLCQSMKGSFSELPKERVWGEFSKLASKSVTPSKSLDVLHQTGWEDHFPSLAAVRDVPQDPEWHPEGPVHVHLGLSADSAAAMAERDQLDDEERTVVVLAAMLHDLGKATHTQIGKTGRITSHGHAEAGVEPARDFLERIGTPRSVKDKVLPIIDEHMCHSSVQGEPTETAVRRLTRRLLGTNNRGPSIETWARVVDADVTGRGAGNKEPFGEQWVAMSVRLGDGQTRPPAALLRGEHLMATGMKPGPDFAKIIDASVLAQDEGVFDDEAGAKRWLDQHLGNRVGD